MKKMMKMIATVVMILAISVPTFATEKSALETYGTAYSLTKASAWIKDSNYKETMIPLSYLTMKQEEGEEFDSTDWTAFATITDFVGSQDSMDMATKCYKQLPFGTDIKDSFMDIIYATLDGDTLILFDTFAQTTDNDCYLIELPFIKIGSQWVLMEGAITCEKV